MRKIAIIGATSAIAVAAARRWAAEGAAFFLVARNEEKLTAVANDLKVRGAQATHSLIMDANDLAQHSKLIEQLKSTLGQAELVLIAHGSLPDQKRCEADPEYALLHFQTNCTSVIYLLTHLANLLEAQKFGCLAVISSVAGDRGRPSNYLYGSAKAAVSAFCDGLRARLFKAGVSVLVIKPGMVATPMTAGLDLPQKLVAQPETVGEDIDMAVRRKADTIYTPGYWRLIMLVIKSIPTFVFKRTNL